MKLEILLNLPAHIGIKIDPVMPLPAVGDGIMVMTSDGSLGGTVTSRLFAQGTDPRTGEPLTQVTLTAE